MNKQLICLLCGIAMFMSAQAQQKFTIKGQLTDVSEGKIMLQYVSDGQQISDSTFIRNGVFKLTGKIFDPQRATLTLKGLQEEGPLTVEKMLSADKQNFFLEKGVITVRGSNNIKSAVIKGGKTQDDYMALKELLKPMEDKLAPMIEKMREYIKDKDEAAQSALLPQMRTIRKDMTAIENTFISEHPSSFVSFDLVRAKASIIDPKTFEPYFNGLSAELRNSKEGKALAERLEIAKKTDIGQPAMNFTQNNTDGTPVTLASLKGKYVLVDFWASWCGPCRAENPNVVKAYEKFKSKNFEIIGVSLDNKKEPWIKAIDKDGLPWIHVSDLNGWKNAVAVAYGVQAVPQNFLLDPNGIIIGKNLRGEELDKKLTELIKN